MEDDVRRVREEYFSVQDDYLLFNGDGPAHTTGQYTKYPVADHVRKERQDTLNLMHGKIATTRIRSLSHILCK